MVSNFQYIFTTSNNVNITLTSRTSEKALKLALLIVMPLIHHRMFILPDQNIASFILISKTSAILEASIITAPINYSWWILIGMQGAMRDFEATISLELEPSS